MDGFDPQAREEIAAGERWLAGFETPEQSEASLGKVKQAIREELACRQVEGAPERRPAWHGVLAAAAAIGLCVTVGWYSTHVEWPATDSTWPAVASGDIRDAEADAFEQSIEALATTDEGLAGLEVMTSDSAWTLSGAALYEALEDAVSDDAADDVNGMGVLFRLEGVLGGWEVVS